MLRIFDIIYTIFLVWPFSSKMFESYSNRKKRLQYGRGLLVVLLGKAFHCDFTFVVAARAGEIRLLAQTTDSFGAGLITSCGT